METASVAGIKKYLPNMMSLIRIFGALALPFLMWSSWDLTLRFAGLTFERVPLIWTAVYLLLVITDSLDGALARRLHAESELGAALDAIGDALILVVGATCVFSKFVYEDLAAWQFWFYVGIMLQCLSDKFIVFAVAKKYFGKGNMLHSVPHKTFAVGAYLTIAYWAFMRTIQLWSILLLWAVMTYAVIDECIYLARAKTYDVDFKGHGFEKYELRRQ